MTPHKRKPNPRPQSHPGKAGAPGLASETVAVHTAEPTLVTIEKPIYGGQFLARVDGKAVFVPLTLPGEEVRVRISEHKKGYATAEPDEIVRVSPDRIQPTCPHFGICGGCNYQHTGVENQLAFKQTILRETFTRAGVTAPEQIEVLSGNPWAYRNRIRLAFDADGRPGYRSRRSHAIIPIAECPIAAPLLVEAAFAAEKVLRTNAHSLKPREVSLFSNASETELLATFFIAGTQEARFDEFAAALSDRVPALRGAELVLEDGSSQRFTARLPRTVGKWGANSLTYHAAGFDYRVDHGAFFQVNRWLVDALVERVTSGHRGALAWDLFAGVGLFARALTASFDHVVAVESAPQAVEALEHNLAGVSARAVRANTLDFLRRSPQSIRPDLIVVDPPRTGLGADITMLLAEVAPPSLVYVSCDPATLARDLRQLLASGYAIQALTLADLFPQTYHLESVVHLRHS